MYFLCKKLFNLIKKLFLYLVEFGVYIFIRVSLMLLIFIFKNSCLLFIDLCFFINFIFNFFFKKN